MRMKKKKELAGAVGCMQDGWRLYRHQGEMAKQICAIGEKTTKLK